MLFVRDAPARPPAARGEAELERLFWDRRFEDMPEDPWLAAEDDEAWLGDPPTLRWRPRPADIVLPPISWRAP